MSSYHHGDLRRRLLELAAEIAAEQGTEAVTLRELARTAKVSHSAPVHHFTSRRNLLTALAVQGFTSLNTALGPHAGNIYDMGVAYVLWALEHPGHYAVMWQPQALAARDEELNRARRQAWILMSRAIAASDSRRVEPADSEERARTDAYAAFAVVHGLSDLWLSGAVPRPDDPAELAGEITRRLVFTST